MSRRARARAAVIDAKRMYFAPPEEDDFEDDEGSAPDAYLGDWLHPDYDQAAGRMDRRSTEGSAR
jgi:hypothetical protein